MTITEIAVDLIRERDQLKQRVRELEAAKAKYENMLSALLIHGQPKGELEERISKAREILTATIPQSQLALEIIRAVEALEGK